MSVINTLNLLKLANTAMPSEHQHDYTVIAAVTAGASVEVTADSCSSVVLYQQVSLALFCHLSLHPCPDILHITEDLFASYGERCICQTYTLPLLCHLHTQCDGKVSFDSIGRFNRFLSETASVIINQLRQITTVKSGAIDPKAWWETALTLFVFLINCYILYFSAGINRFIYI